ncbi:MAG: threonine--tRNA ligase [Actinomycetia bacterium]|nr:threonine--tRNA ligase [Actinomycetes bacterium]
MADTVLVRVGEATHSIERGTPLADLVPDPLRGSVLAALFNGRPVDLGFRVGEDGTVDWLTFDHPAGRRIFRHSSAHLLAQAVKRRWPTAQLGTGPALEDGFYYDIRLPEPLTAEDLAAIEATMRAIVAEDLPVERQELSREEARRLFAERGEPFKVEIVERIPADVPISVYRQGEFVDLCSGPHVPRTGVLRAVRLTTVSGAYWRGDERQPMLSRIYGTSFPDEAQLTAYLERVEEAKRRDHRRLGPQMGLFVFRDEAPGFTFWLPKGVTLYRKLEAFSRRLQEPLGYQEVSTPWIFRASLWETSGHWQHYRDNMFVVERDDERLGVKPMNCPGHCLLYAGETRSYRDLPLKLAEYGPLSRFERSGTLHGLMRARGFHQDDAHLFVRPDQIADQIAEVLGLVDAVYGALDMPVAIELSTRPEDYLGDLETWDVAEAQLKAALERSGRPYAVRPGEGAFYGPKLDFHVTDALGRQWQTATVQLDFQMPRQFDLVYVDAAGQRQRPVMIHRAVFGSLERFIGILVEHFNGWFPLWLAPEPVRVLPLADDERPYAEAVARDLRQAGVTATVDGRREKLGYKIRQAQLERVPVALVIGRREVEAHTVAVRWQGEDRGTQPWPAYLETIRQQAMAPGQAEGDAP